MDRKALKMALVDSIEGDMEARSQQEEDEMETC
jgi:hypothetical protein